MLASKIEATEEQLNRIFQTKLGTIGSPPRFLSIRKISGEGSNKAAFCITTTPWGTAGYTNCFLAVLCRDPQGALTRNMVNVLRLVQQRTSIPVPQIFAFEDDNTRSPFSVDCGGEVLGCPYVLMEAVEGQNIHKIFNNLESKKTCVLQVADILAELQNLLFSVLGGFSSSNMEGDFPVVGKAPVFLSYETIPKEGTKERLSEGPFHSTWEYYVRALSMWSSMLCKSEDSKAVEVGEFCSSYSREVLRKRIEEEQATNDKGGKGKFVLVHGDFGTYNIMADPDSGRVTGVIDWEGAFAGPIEYDLSGLRKVIFAEPRKKKDEEGYEQEVQMAKLFKDRVEERGGKIKVDWSFKECSWLERLAMSLVTWRGWFPAGPEHEA